VIYGADDRYVGNVFVGGELDRAYAPGSRFHDSAGYGLGVYQGHPTTFAEYLDRIEAQPMGDHQRFPGVKQPVYARGNVYAAGASASDADQDPVVLDGEAGVEVVEEGDAVYLQTRLPEGFDRARVGIVTGRDLEHVRFVDADFEDRDGHPVVLDTDLLGDRKADGQEYAAGPVAGLHGGTGRVRVW
jgi:hypothetical protein